MAERHTLLSGAGLWSLVFVVLTLGLQWLPGAAEQLQFVRPTYATGAWWQLFTAQWVHMGSLHAVANVLGMVVLLRAFQGLVSGRLQLLSLLGGYAGVAVVLALDPHCAVYAGASGALHGLLAGCAGALFISPPPPPMTRQRMHILACCVLLVLAAKLLVQHFDASPTATAWLGFATYYPAHEAGALGGLLAVMGAVWLLPQAARALQRPRRAGPGAGR
jgi:rhomboid family GlyGly-CTERM serine protease